jgi:hypothetical protein
VQELKIELPRMAAFLIELTMQVCFVTVIKCKNQEIITIKYKKGNACYEEYFSVIFNTYARVWANI